MINNPTVDDTIRLIQTLHDGQFDWTGIPYFHHPVAVMNRLPDDSPIERRLIALLHDVIEDCKENIAAIINEPVDAFRARQYLVEQGYSTYVLDGVWLLTREADPNIKMTYIEEIRNIAASGHVDAMYSKLSDNCENTSDARYLNLSDTDKARALEMRPRYERSKKILRDRLVELGHDISWSL